MYKFYFLIAFFSSALINLNAQFIDDMESYAVGQPINQGHWTDWGYGGGEGCAIMSTNLQARSGQKSGLIQGDDTTSAVIDFGNMIFGYWGLEFFMYIPSGNSAVFNLQGEVPINGGESIVGNIYFNKSNNSPGIGFIEDTALGFINFTFPHDTWFQVIMNVDILFGISVATWMFNVDGNSVIPPGTGFTNGDGIIPTSLGGINYFSTGDDYFLDDFRYENDTTISIVDHDLAAYDFFSFPNPVTNFLYLSAKEEITEVSLFNILGQEIVKKNINSLNGSIDMSQLNNGIYFLKVKIGNSEGTIKIIK